MLCGRSEQLAAIRRLLEGLRSGPAEAPVLRREGGGGAWCAGVGFAGRRLQGERAAVLVGARDEPPGVGLPGLPELRVGGLDQTAAEQLLAGAGLVAAVRDQLIAEAGGEPLALIQLPPGLSAAGRAGAGAPPGLPPASAGCRGAQAVRSPARRAGRDGRVAAGLDAAAQGAARRGSRAAASAAYERAAALSAGPAAKGRRLALAAAAATDAGQLPRAADLAGQAGQLVTDPAAAMVMARVRAQLEFEAGRPAGAAGLPAGWGAPLGPGAPGAAAAGVGRGAPLLCVGR